MTRQSNEMRSFRLELETFLASRGWTDVTIKEGFGFDATIINPMIAITEMPLRNEQLQMGDTEQKQIQRVFQIDAYMEAENRAKAIWDDLDDFMDQTVIAVTDPSNTSLGYMQSQTRTIRGEILPPNMVNPKVIRWRGIIRATFDVYYL